MQEATDFVRAYNEVRLSALILAVVLLIVLGLVAYIVYNGRAKLVKAQTEAKTEGANANALTSLTNIVHDSQQATGNFLTALQAMNEKHAAELREREQAHTAEIRERDSTLKEMIGQVEKVGLHLQQIVDSTDALNKWADQLEARVQNNEDTLTGISKTFTQAHEDTRTTINGHTDEQIARVLSGLEELKQLVRSGRVDGELTTRLTHMETQINQIVRSNQKGDPHETLITVPAAADASGSVPTASGSVDSAGGKQ